MFGDAVSAFGLLGLVVCAASATAALRPAQAVTDQPDAHRTPS